MLEDSEDDVLFIERALKKGRLSFEKQSVATQSDYRNALERFKPDVVLSDNVLPGFNSRDALKICRKETGDTPFILVSGTASDEFAATCIREGADDYISKSNLTNLTTSIRTALKKRKDEQLKRETVNDIRKKFRELQAMNESLDTFAYAVTQALRAPLTTLMGLLNVAQQSHDIASLRSLHTMMRTSVSKLDSTLIGLLEHARNAHSEVKHELINWTALVNGVLAKLNSIDQGNRITKLIDLKTEVPFYSDAERITMVLIHLIGNAYVHRNKSTMHESIMGIEVFTTAESAVIIIKDNGPGMSAEIVPRVFDMFFKGSLTTSGAGLGLYLTKLAVEKLNGTIDISSKEGIGTTVRVELPNEPV